MNASSRGKPRICEPERQSWPNARSAGDWIADAHATIVVAARQGHDEVGGVWRPERRTRDGLIEALAALSGRCGALTARNRELAGDVKPLRAERRRLRSEVATAGNGQPVTLRPARADPDLGSDDERQRLERDLHDGVENELVSLMIRLRLAEEGRRTPPEFAGTLSALGAHAQAVLDNVREIAHGIYPSSLAAFGVEQAVRAHVARTTMNVRVEGTAPRSTEQAGCPKPRLPCTSPA